MKTRVPRAHIHDDEGRHRGWFEQHDRDRD
jgi:hypothetical protein